MNKPKLIIITTNDILKNEADAIAQLFENGLEALHLRKKTFFKNELSELIESIDKKWHNNIVLHTHPQLVLAYNLKGFHFNKSYPYNEQMAEALKQAKKTLSVSSHSICDMSEYSLDVDYQFVSPIFASNSKQNANDIIDHTKLKNYLMLKPGSQFIALSGIAPDNISTVINLGFDGVAVLGYLWNDFEEDQNIDNLIKRFLKLQNAINLKREI